MITSKLVLRTLIASAVSYCGVADARASAAAPVPIVWVNAVNATASGGTLTKVGGCGGCYDAGAVSQQRFTSGSISFTVATRQELAVGLDAPATSPSAQIAYSFRFSGLAWEVRERGLYRTDGTLAATDVFSIAVSGTTVIYSVNGKPVYTSTVPVAGVLAMEASIASLSGSVTTATVSDDAATTVSSDSPPPLSPTTTDGTSTAVTWTNAVNATVNGSTLTKKGGCASCFDAGATSQQQISSGSISFSVPAAVQLFAGMGGDTSSSTAPAAINYAFKFNGSGWEVREANIYRTEGAYAAGDIFSIVVAGTTAQYFRNGALVYTSKVPVASPLVMDTAILTAGGSITNATITGSSLTSTSVPAAALRVLQWNTHHGGYGTDGVYSPDRLASWAASFNPDVVSLNEIERNDYWGNQDQPEVYKALLQQKTGKTWYYVFAQEFGQWSSSGKGNLILSTFPIAISDRYELVHNADRSIAMAVISVNGRPITLMSTHLDPYDATLRLAQANDVTYWASPQPENRIIMGDMNAWPDQASIAQFNTFYNDSWAVAAANGSAVAFAGNTGETKSGRIDYIFYSKKASNLTVQSSQVYDTRDGNGIMPSDHRPVLTVFAVR